MRHLLYSNGEMKREEEKAEDGDTGILAHTDTHAHAASPSRSTSEGVEQMDQRERERERDTQRALVEREGEQRKQILSKTRRVAQKKETQRESNFPLETVKQKPRKDSVGRRGRRRVASMCLSHFTACQLPSHLVPCGRVVSHAHTHTHRRERGASPYRHGDGELHPSSSSLVRGLSSAAVKTFCVPLSSPPPPTPSRLPFRRYERLWKEGERERESSCSRALCVTPSPKSH